MLRSNSNHVVSPRALAVNCSIFTPTESDNPSVVARPSASVLVWNFSMLIEKPRYFIGVSLMHPLMVLRLIHRGRHGLDLRIFHDFAHATLQSAQS